MNTEIAEVPAVPTLIRPEIWLAAVLVPPSTKTLDPVAVVMIPLDSVKEPDPAWFASTRALPVVPERLTSFVVVSPLLPAKLKAPEFKAMIPFWA